ncbi:hypothetical protein [Desulfurivibrio sp. C05AmB]|uniref:hypothetical protein n=1 Tax=Desulfurivibrio sp. C05AmB TaxID=3374371 RepID=UPI00376F082A
MDICKEATSYILKPALDARLAEDPESGRIYLEPEQLESFQGGFSLGEYRESGEECLGYYHPMSSPGTIALYRDKLRGFFWSIIQQLEQAGHAFWLSDLEALAHITVFKTWTHEHFHLFCDIQSHILRSATGTGGPDHDLEEALAVAHSNRQVMDERRKWQTRTGRIHPSIFAPFMRFIYNYQAPGYADWKLYDGDDLFADGLITLLAPEKAAWLEANGVPLGRLLAVQLDQMLLVRKNEVLL